MAEAWRIIPDRGDFYEASSLGRVRSKDRVLRVASRWGGTRPMPCKGRVLKPWADGNGYQVVYVCHDDQRVAVNVHRLVALAFLDADEGRHVNHKNGNKSDNRPENLEWVTRSGNMRHAITTGLMKIERAVIATPKGGGPSITFNSIKEAALAVGSARATNINRAAKGERPYAYGHSWKHLEAA